jgi:hypothetical protein
MDAKAENYLDMVGVTGSIPVAPTINFKDLAGFGVLATKRWPHRHTTRRSPAARLAIDGAASRRATPPPTKGRLRSETDK